MDVGETSFDQIYRGVNEYRSLFPGKAIVYSRRVGELSNWAVFMAGGSFASLPVINAGAFFENAAEMSVIKMENPKAKQYVLGKAGTGYIIFCESPEIKVDLSDDHNNYSLHWINPSTGAILNSEIRISGSVTTSIKAPFEGAVVGWLCKE